MRPSSFCAISTRPCIGIIPDTQTIAEESTAWPMVSRPIYLGGLGFGMKWNMGWMHDTLDYFSRDPIHRKYHHDQLTFSIMYAFHENFVLPLSHDEVVHGKGSLLGKMPGDDWQKFANLRLLVSVTCTGIPAKSCCSWAANSASGTSGTTIKAWIGICWSHAPHQGVQRWMKDLNHFYRNEPALYARDFDASGFEWIDLHDWEQSIISFLRKGESPDDLMLVVCNFTPVPHANYRVGVPRGGYWAEVLNSDATLYGGSGQGNLGGVEASPVPAHGRYYSLSLTLPPLGVLFFKASGTSKH